MIKYQLKCTQSHEFEGWFRNSSEYDQQANDGLLSCPLCGSDDVSKAIMAPAISRRSNRGQAPQSLPTPTPEGDTPTPSSSEAPITAANPPAVFRDEKRLNAIRKDLNTALERARQYVEKNFDYVGENFPEEARKIHYNETKPRAIYGEANIEDVEELIDEGIDIVPVPKVKTKKTDQSKPEVIKNTERKMLN